MFAQVIFLHSCDVIARLFHVSSHDQVVRLVLSQDRRESMGVTINFNCGTSGTIASYLTQSANLYCSSEYFIRRSSHVSYM